MSVVLPRSRLRMDCEYSTLACKSIGPLSIVMRRVAPTTITDRTANTPRTQNHDGMEGYTRSVSLKRIKTEVHNCGGGTHNPGSASLPKRSTIRSTRWLLPVLQPRDVVARRRPSSGAVLAMLTILLRESEAHLGLGWSRDPRRGFSREPE